MNRHWLATFLGRKDLAAEIAKEAAAREAGSPFAAAYFARDRLDRGDTAGAAEWVRRSPAAPDAHGRTELALASMRAGFQRGDLAGLFAAYAARMAGSDGDRDRQHVAIHFVDAMERMWEDRRPGFGPAEFAGEARAVVAREPGEVGHRWTLWSLLSSAGQRQETIQSLLDSYDAFRDKASHREFIVACAWRVLESAEPAKPN